MPDATPDLAAVAAKLSKAQWAAVLGQRRLSSGGGMWGLRNALAEKGLVSGPSAQWTPFGLRLREYLQDQEREHG